MRTLDGLSLVVGVLNLVSFAWILASAPLESSLLPLTLAGTIGLLNISLGALGILFGRKKEE